MHKNSSQPIQSNRVVQLLISHRIELTPKSPHQTPTKADHYSHQRFDKTLNKPKSVQHHHHHHDTNNNNNDLIYSSEQSDKQTEVNINRHTGSQTNLFNNNNYVEIQNNMYSKSQQQIRPRSEYVGMFERKREEAVEMSDNFQTPKSKYRGMKGEENGRNVNMMKKTSGIKFTTTVGESRKSKASDGMNNNKDGEKKAFMKRKENGSNSEEGPVMAEGQVLIENETPPQVGKYMSEESSSKSSLESASNIKVDGRQLVFEESISKQSKPAEDPQLDPQLQPEPPSRNDSSVSNVYAAQLNEQLKLNYDYYFFKPVKGRTLKSDKKIQPQSKNPNKEKEEQKDEIVNPKDERDRQQMEESPYYHYEYNSFQDRSNRLVGSFARESSASESGEIDITF